MKWIPKWLPGALFISSPLLCIAFLVSTRPTKAEPAPGLFFEQQTSAGGIEVRRLRDAGNGVVCYVAKGPIADGDMGTRAFGIPTAISCVKDAR
jgi:hypothetical protein